MCRGDRSRKPHDDRNNKIEKFRKEGAGKKSKMEFRRGINLHHEFTGGNLPKAGSKKGRSSELIKARNECLLYRYYYYAKMLHWVYESVISELQKEFYLKGDTIPRIIQENFETIKGIVKENITVKELAKKFPYLTWNQKAIEHKEVKHEVYNRY